MSDPSENECGYCRAVEHFSAVLVHMLQKPHDTPTATALCSVIASLGALIYDHQQQAEAAGKPKEPLQ